jgi:predicted N-acetyltransferase YhbS
VVRIGPLTRADVAAAVELAVRVLRVKPGDRREQFAADITGEQRKMFVAKANGQVVAYGRIIKLAADEAAPGTPAGYYLSGVLVDPAWRGRGIATALTRARLRWAFARTSTVFYVTGGGQRRLFASARSSRFPGNQALRERTLPSWRGCAVATSEHGGPHRQRVTA